MALRPFKNMRYVALGRLGGIEGARPSDGVPLPIASAEQFAQTLSHERKRTDRSGTPFLLMLLDIGSCLQSNSTASSVERICLALVSSIRETDVLGWHTSQAVLGVLFTGLNLKESISVAEVIRRKVVAAFASRLQTEELSRIRITFHLYPDNWKMTDRSAPNLDLYPDLKLRGETKKRSHMAKRFVDIAGSAMALLVLSPALAVIAVFIRLTSKGPVLFRQVRVGWYGRPFTLLKFRTMKSKADESMHKRYVQELIKGNGYSADSRQEETSVYKIKDDPRITPIGKLLRKTSLDELPQFWNVLTGKMSLVGPRPPIPYEVECYDTWHRRRVLEVKPGITGLWQVYGRSRTDFNDMVRLDLQYARSWSLWLDLKILFRTPGAVVSGDGAY